MRPAFAHSKRQPRSCSPSVEMRAERAVFKSFTQDLYNSPLAFLQQCHCRACEKSAPERTREGKGLEWRKGSRRASATAHKGKDSLKMLRRYLADCMWRVQSAGTPLVGPHLISPGLHNAGATLCLVVPGEGRVPILALVQSRSTLPFPLLSISSLFVPRPSSLVSGRPNTSRLLSRFCLSLRHHHHHPLSLLHNTAFFLPHVFTKSRSNAPSCVLRP